MGRIEELVKELEDAKIAYYSGETTTIPDALYDELEKELSTLDPTNPILKQVGTKNDSNTNKVEVIHEIPCLSMNKCQTIEDFSKWYNGCLDKLQANGFKAEDESIVIEPKIDGISGDLLYVNGIFIRAATRGDGKIGSKILNAHKLHCILPMLNNRNKYNNKSFHIRGEFYIPKNRKVNNLPPDTPLRNYANGLLKRLEISTEDASLLEFIAYDIVPYNELNILGDLDITDELFDMGYNPIPIIEINEAINGEINRSDTIEYVKSYYDNYNKEIREIMGFESDGLVITFNNIKVKEFLDTTKVIDHHHVYNIAYKPSPEGGWTKLIDVEWNVSRNSLIVPTGIVSPVKIGDDIYRRVTLNNISYIRQNDIKLNDEVYIIRSNDVIPKLIKNRHTINSIDIYLDKCPSCASKVIMGENNTHYICPNKDCSSKVVKKFLYWFKMNNIENFGEKMLEEFLNRTHLEHLWQLYSFNKEELEKLFEDILNIDMTTKTMQRFIYTLEKSRFQREIDIIGKYGIPKIGPKVLEKLDINSYNELIYYQDPKNLANNQKIIASLCLWMNTSNNLEQLEHLLYELSPFLIVKQTKVNDHSKKTFCITGTFNEKRDKIVLNIENSLPEWKFSPTVTKDLNLLIVGQMKNGEKSSKLDAAIKYGHNIIRVPYIVSYNELLTKMKDI